jgi:hypothetical protein
MEISEAAHLSQEASTGAQGMRRSYPGLSIAPLIPQLRSGVVNHEAELWFGDGFIDGIVTVEAVERFI